MPGKVLFLHCCDGPISPYFERMVAEGLVVAVRQDRFSNDMLEGMAGLVTCADVDQIDLQSRRAALEAFVAAKGRIVFSCQFRRQFMDGISIFIPTANAGRADYALTRLSPHPIFDGMEAASLEKRRGVAGFYGRGYNPPPPGATPVTGLGPMMLPVDWAWDHPSGGKIFSHAGNDLWVLGDDFQQRETLARRLVAWSGSRQGK